MATIKFRLKSQVNKINTIYVYASLGRNKYYEVKTGFEISPFDWQEKLNFPKQNTPENKNLHSDLKKLEAFIHDGINRANSKGELIDKFWLEKQIRACFNRTEKTDTGLLINHIQYIIDGAHLRKVRGKNGLGISESRIKSYVTFKNIVTQYQLVIRKTIHLTDVGSQFVELFTRWLLDNQGFSINYAGKQIDNLKTICTDAERLGISVNPFAKNIQSFAESDEDRFIVTFSFEELSRIRDAKMPTESLENVKKWLLIGCEMGQRGEDLLNISLTNSRFKEKILFIDVFQSKLKKWVTIPILSPFIVDLILNKTPYRISIDKLNKYLKIVCKFAEIDNQIEGKKRTLDEKGRTRKVLGVFPKWELVASHSFRRSYATNYYKNIATPVLMEITGHSRETTFLKYINKQKDKDENALLFAKLYHQMLAKEEWKS